MKTLALFLATVLVASTLFVSESQASICMPGSVSGASDCEGSFKGNDSQDVPGGYFFGEGGWTLIEKIDIGKKNYYCSPDIKDCDLFVSTRAGAVGLFTFDPVFWEKYSQIMVALKASNRYSLYNLKRGSKGGRWFIDFTNNGKKTPDLSHFSLYGIEEVGDIFDNPTDPIPDPPVVTTPLPAAGWFFLTGLGGLIAFRRKKA